MNNLPNNDSIINAPTQRVYLFIETHITTPGVVVIFAKNGHYTKRIPPQGEGAGLICMTHEKNEKRCKTRRRIALEMVSSKSN